MIILILDLEVTVCRCVIIHVNHVLCVNEFGQLGVSGCASPGAIMKRTLHDNLEVSRGVGC